MLQGGYCHIIDDESSFKPTFGRDVIAGMLQVDPEFFGGRKGMHGRKGVGLHEPNVAQFRKAWDPFDWTKMLD